MLLPLMILVCLSVAGISCVKQKTEDKKISMVENIKKKNPDIILSFIHGVEIETEYVVEGNMLYDSRFRFHKKELKLSSNELKEIKQLLTDLNLDSTYREKYCLYPEDLIGMRLGDSTCTDTIEVIVTDRNSVELTVNDKLVYISERPQKSKIYNNTIKNLKSLFDSLLSTSRVKHFE